MINKSDWNKVPVDPDEGFSADHNKQVIDGVIDHTDKMIKRKKTQHKDALQERSWAISQYLKGMEMGGESNMSKYFGKREMARLQGESVMNKMRAWEEKRKRGEGVSTKG